MFCIRLYPSAEATDEPKPTKLLLTQSLCCPSDTTVPEGQFLHQPPSLNKVFSATNTFLKCLLIIKAEHVSQRGGRLKRHRKYVYVESRSWVVMNQEACRTDSSQKLFQVCALHKPIRVLIEPPFPPLLHYITLL